MKNKFLYNFLSFTWGIVMTTIGGIVALILLICGKKPKRHGGSIFFVVGKDWGGVDLGRVFVCSKDSEDCDELKNHEFGHSFQNAWWGPLFPFVVAIPSAIRYWYRELKYYKKGKYPPTDYDSIWFEGQATALGNKYIEYYK